VFRFEELPFNTGPAEVQLARTDALWRAVAGGEAGPTLRWYGFSRPALVLGVSQDKGVVDLERCGRRGVDVTQRSSGGTVVLADQDALSLDMALPATHPLASGDVVEAYRWIGAALAASVLDLAPALRGRLMVVDPVEARADQQAARAAPAHSGEALRARACFGTLSPFEVALAGPTYGLAGAYPWAHGDRGTGGRLRKLVGLAQLRKRGVVLFQAGLHVRFSGLALAELLALPEPDRLALGVELDGRVAGLADVGLGPADTRRLIAAFTRAAGGAAASATLPDQARDAR
jgi:lipoate-protein ligase A